MWSHFPATSVWPKVYYYSNEATAGHTCKASQPLSHFQGLEWKKLDQRSRKTVQINTKSIELQTHQSINVQIQVWMKFVPAELL